MTAHNPFKYFKTSPKIIRLAVMYYVRYPLSFRQVEDILYERGIDICHETVRFWVERFGSKFAGEIRKNRAGHHSNWQWHLDEVFVKINGERFYLEIPVKSTVLVIFITFPIYNLTQATSNKAAAPMPPPTHMDVTTYFTPRRFPSSRACPTCLAPVMP